jgi:hypothetical protein
MINAANTDWMEWQAGYACGALLMPKTAVVATCRAYVEKHKIYGTISLQAAHGASLITTVTEVFQVSADAARVRLLKLGLVTEAPPNRTLFG